MEIETLLLDDGSEVHFEISDQRPGIQPVGIGAVDGVKKKFREAVDGIAPLTEELLDAIRSVSRKPDSVEVQMSIKVSGEMGAIIAKATTEGNFLVKVKWTNVG